MSDTFTTLDGITVDDIPVKFVAGNVLTDIDDIFVVDPTLSVSGAAADAKVTGDTINDLSDSVDEDIDALKEDLNVINDGGYISKPIAYNEGGYITDYYPGSIISYNGWKYTDYIDISGSKNGKILIKMYAGSGAETTDGNNYNAWYDANKNYVGKLVVTNDVLSIPDNAVYIRLSTRSAYIHTLSVYVNGCDDIINADALDADYINFMTWNVGIFKDGTHKPTTEEAPSKIIEMKKMIGDINPNFLNAEEYVDIVDDANTISSGNIFTFKYPNKVNRSSNKCFSKLRILNSEVITFNSGSGRNCIAYDVMLNNRQLTIINAHLSIELNPATYRNADIAQLITYMNTKERVILSGDFNVASDAEYDAFKTAGYVLCNGGAFGWFDTWPVMANMWDGFTPDWPCLHLDNIIVSSNIVPQNVKTIECGVSDHAPLFATLKVM